MGNAELSRSPSPTKTIIIAGSGLFRLPEVLTEAEVIEAEAELKALQRHALEVVDPEAES